MGFPCGSAVKESACNAVAAAAAKSLQSFLTLCDPTYGSPPGSSVHGIFQARVLEWVAIAFSGNAVDLVLIPGLERSPKEGKGYPLQYSGLENSILCSPWDCKESDMTK